MKYLISLKHTRKTDPFITLWGPNNAGYVWSIERAGQYNELEKGYHDSDDTLPVDIEVLDRMASTITYDGELKSMIPQNRYTLAELGLKRTPKGLKPTKMKTEEKAFEAGARAYKKHHDRPLNANNPFKKDTANFYAWRVGWNSALLNALNKKEV